MSVPTVREHMELFLKHKYRGRGDVAEVIRDTAVAWWGDRKITDLTYSCVFRLLGELQRGYAIQMPGRVRTISGNVVERIVVSALEEFFMWCEDEYKEGDKFSCDFDGPVFRPVVRDEVGEREMKNVEYMSQKEVSEATGVSRSRLQRLSAMGRFPQLVKIPGSRSKSRPYYLREQVDAWIRANGKRVPACQIDLPVENKPIAVPELAPVADCEAPASRGVEIAVTHHIDGKPRGLSRPEEANVRVTFPGGRTMDFYVGPDKQSLAIQTNFKMKIKGDPLAHASVVYVSPATQENA